MSSKKYNFPVFETLELTTEPEYNNQRYETLKPIKVGDKINGLTTYKGFKQQGGHFAKVMSRQSSSASQLNKTQVLCFYSKHWGEAGLTHLKQLHAIRHEVKYHDANLLIIDADGEDSVLKHTLCINNLQLPVYDDSNNMIAKLFNIYSEKSPAWSNYAGLDTNVPLPSVFVLDHYLQVVFDFSNQEIASDLPLQNIINAVYQANNYLADKKIA
jgi:peroxiredoxin